jgi:hypothetical protein
MAWRGWGSYGLRFQNSWQHSDFGRWGYDGTKSYHNGGVEGNGFSLWYNSCLAGHYSGDASDGTKGSGSGGTKGSGTGGTKGSGSGGTKGSGTGGTKGSGSGGTKGSGSGGTHCGTGGTQGGGTTGGGGGGGGGSTDGKTTVEFIVGTEPQVNVEVTQTPQGQLFMKLSPTTVDGPFADIDGIFFNMTDDATLNGLNFFPDENALPVTGHEANANAVNTLDNGTTVPGAYDAMVQFGQVPDSTDGNVQGVNFTLWSDNGPLTLDDIDLSNMTLVIDSESANPQIISGGYTGGAAASSGDSYHNGGVEGDGFDKWYEDNLEDHYCGSGSGGTKGSGSGGTKGSGSGGTKGSGSGGTKGSGSGGTKGSGSGGTKGSGSGGTKGSGSGGTKGSGSGGTKGSGSGGTKGSGSGGTKGSGSGGTKGSGSGGTKGSGTGGSGHWGGKMASLLPAYDGEPDDTDNGDDVVYASGSGGSGGTKGSGGGWTSPSLDDIMALMTKMPDENDPSLQDPDDPMMEDDGYS